MAYIRKSLRIDEEVYKEIEKVSGKNFNRWVNLLIDRELNADGGKSAGDAVEKQVNSEKLDVLLDENLISLLNEKGGEVLGSLSNLELAKLAVQRAPKALNLDYDHEKTLLSLRESLKHLPEADDLRKELIKVKGEYSKLKLDYDAQVSSIRSLRTMFANIENGEVLFKSIRKLCQEISEKSYALREEDELRGLVHNGIEVMRIMLNGKEK